MKLNFLFIVVTLFISPIAYSSEKIVLISHGIYSSTDVTRMPDQGSPTGYSNKSKSTTLINTSKKIPMVLGKKFGLKYRIDKNCANKPEITQKIIIPKPFMIRPTDGRKIIELVQIHSAECGKPYEMLFTFDEEWEMVPGNWLFNIENHSETLLSIEFSIE